MTKNLRLLVAIVLIFIFHENALADDSLATPKSGSVSVLPILMYDSDIGVGFGGKAVITRQENYFDLTLFGSTKGEQWYAFAFSAPAPNARLGNTFPLAVDIKFEYDKLLKSGYFGIGNRSADNDFAFPRESFRLQATASRAFNTTISGGIFTRFMHYSAYGFLPGWPITSLTPGAGESDLQAIGAIFKRDTRDNDVNPQKGTRSMLVLEQTFRIMGTNWDFQSARLELSIYHALLGKRDIIASRLWLRQVWGSVPFQELPMIGDGWTARGFKAGRYLDRALALASIEYRIPLYKKLGGVAFVDCGRVWPSLSDFSLREYHADWGGGLRLYLTDFVARLDIGHSVEGNRIFFNFGQVF